MPEPHSEYSSSPIRLIAAVLFFSAAYFLASLLVPFLVALVLAIAFTPIATWIERKGVGRSGASGICVLGVLGFLVGTGALIAYQARGIVKDCDKSINRIGDLTAKAIQIVGGESFLKSITQENDAKKEAGSETEKALEDAIKDRSSGETLVFKAKEALQKETSSLGRWAASGVGGIAGLLADAVIFLAFLFYMLQGRADWLERLKKAAIGLGMKPRNQAFGRVAKEVRIYLGTLALVSLCYVVVVSLTLWLIGVPQPLLWGVLTGLLEVIPYLGPVIAGALPTFAALGSGGAAWQPLAVIGVFVILQTVEGNIVAPMLYGKAVEIEPVTVLFGVLFFGFLLGPAGLALAMPLMILLRGVLIMMPDTPTLDALADAKPECSDIVTQGSGSRSTS